MEPKHLPPAIARLKTAKAPAPLPGPVAGACFTEMNVMGVEPGLKDTVTVALPMALHVDVTIGWANSEHFCLPGKSAVQVAPSICLPGDAAPAAVTASSRTTMWSAM